MFCVFECKSSKCVKNKLPSFGKVICDRHLNFVFGLATNIKSYHPADADVYVGPFLHVARDITFEKNTVLIPTRRFVDVALGLKIVSDGKNDDDGERESDRAYVLNPRFDNFMRQLMSSTNNAESLFLSEIARNLLVEGSNHVNLMLKSDKVKGELKGRVQMRLEDLKRNIKNEDYYSYCENHITIHQLPNVTRDKSTLGAFEYFMLFNMMPDQLVTYPGCLPEHNNANLAYVDGVGYVTMSRIVSPMDLVVCGKYESNAQYQRWKERRDYKSCVGKQVNPRLLGDSQNVRNIYETLC